MQVPAGQEERCAACGGGRLEMRMRVRGQAGPDGLAPTTDRYGTALADIVRCADCLHMQLDRFPPQEELDGAYVEAESFDYVEEEVGQRATALGTLNAIERYAKPGRLLDLGCWVGYLMSEAEGRGWSAIGVEPSDFASAFARENLGLEVRTCGLFEADLPASEFDAVFLGDVIEHLPNPAGALRRIDSWLAPDGIVAMTLPDSGSRLARAMGRRWWSVIPTHVQYFNRGSIETLLRRSGFSLLSIETAPKTFTVGYYLSRLEGYSAPLSRGLVAAADRLGAGGRPWAPNFRDRMLVLARPVR